MENKNYQILWIDDEYEKLVYIQQKALDSNICFNCFTNAKEAIKDLETNFLFYDAVVLDGLFYRTNEDYGDVTEETALVEVVRVLDRLKQKKVIPWFVLTGQQKIKMGTGFLAAYDIKPYDKLDINDIDKLFCDIKKAANQLIFTQLQHKYQDAFQIFNNYLNVENKKSLLKILISLDSTESLFFEEYNKIRQIYEVIFSLLKEKKIISEELTSLNQFRRFISKVDRRFIYHNDIVHPFIVDLISRNINVCNDGSHDIENLNLQVNEYSKYNIAKYAYSSTVYSLLETLVYLNKFLDENSTNDLSKNWKKKDLIEGKMIRVAEKNYGTFKSNRGEDFTITPYFVKKYNLLANQIFYIVLEKEGSTKISEVILK